MVTLVGVDIGVTNFAFVCAKVTVNLKEIQITKVARVDLAKYDQCTESGCSIKRHGKDASCRIQHLVREYTDILAADILVVEQQPPGGIKDVEHSLVTLAETSGIDVKLVSPRSMHSHYGIQHKSYQNRKQWTQQHFERTVGLITGFSEEHRKHDIADAWCLLTYTLYKMRRARLQELTAQYRFERVGSKKELYNIDLSRFAYIPNK